MKIAALSNFGILFILFGLGATPDQLIKSGSCTVGLTMLLMASNKIIDLFSGESK